MAEATCEIPANFLNDENYVLDALVLSNSRDIHAHARDYICFSAIEKERDSNFNGKVIGLVRPTLKWSTQLRRPAELINELA